MARYFLCSGMIGEFRYAWIMSRVPASVPGGDEAIYNSCKEVSQVKLIITSWACTGISQDIDKSDMAGHGKSSQYAGTGKSRVAKGKDKCCENYVVSSHVC